MKHTPAPWRVEASNVYAFKSDLKIDVCVAKTYDLTKDHTGTGEFSLAEMKANAALIAKAPAMDEALKRVAEWLDADDWSDGDLGLTIDFINSALEE